MWLKAISEQNTIITDRFSNEQKTGKNDHAKIIINATAGIKPTSIEKYEATNI